MDATRADSRIPLERPTPTLANALCALSVLLLALQIWFLGLWLAAVAAGGTQRERVDHFLAHLPFALGRLGPFNVTVLSGVLGCVGAVAGVLAARWLRDAARRLCVGLAAANGTLVLWYVFTLM